MPVRHETDPALFGYKYHSRIDQVRYDGLTQEPCAHCAKPVNITKPHWVVEYGSQGYFAIGTECRRLFPSATRCEP